MQVKPPPETLGVSGPRPLLPAMRAGWHCKCPHCGHGTLFRGYMSLRNRCPSCGEDLSRARVDDGPAYLTLLLTAQITGAAMLAVYLLWPIDPMILLAVFCVGGTALALYLLPRVKGMIVGVQWAKRMNGF